jgi:hypothetical protein
LEVMVVKLAAFAWERAFTPEGWPPSRRNAWPASAKICKLAEATNRLGAILESNRVALKEASDRHNLVAALAARHTDSEKRWTAKPPRHWGTRPGLS